MPCEVVLAETEELEDEGADVRELEEEMELLDPELLEPELLEPELLEPGLLEKGSEMEILMLLDD